MSPNCSNKSLKIKFYNNFFSFLFLTGIFTITFIFWPWAEVVFEIPKVWFINRWIELLAIVGIIFSPLLLKKQKVDTLLLILVLTFFIQVFISSIFGVDFNKSLSGNYFRGDGIFTLVHLIILFLVIFLFFNRNIIKPLIKCFVFSSLLISIWSIINALFDFILKKPIIPAWDKAIGVNFGNPNFLAGYLVVTLPFLAYIYDNKVDKRKLILLAFLVQITAILLTLSRAGILLTLVFFLFWIILTRKNRKLVLLFFVPILFYLMSSINQSFKPTDPRNPSIVIAEGRERIFRKGILSFLKRPILGFGWANFDYAFDSIDWPVKFENDVYVDKAHSHLLEILVTSGFLGFAIYISIIFKTLFNLIKSRDKTSKYLLLSFLLFIIHSQTNIISISEEIIFWIILSLSTKGRPS